MRFSVISVLIAGVPSAIFAQDKTSDAIVVNAPVEPSAIVERNRLVVQKFYPSSSLRRGEEGEVHFRIMVNRNGRLDGCQVTQSSGYAALDTATCDLLLQGATATPLVSSDGWRIAGMRDGIVPWTLPAGVRRPTTPPPFTSARNAAGEALICKRQIKTGSAYIMEKTCLTREDWHRQEQYAQEETAKMQSPKGPVGGPY